MKPENPFFLSAIILLGILTGCEPPKDKPQPPLDEDNDLAGYFYGPDSVLYIRTEYKNDIIELLKAKKINDSVVGFSINDMDLQAALKETSQPTIYTTELFGQLADSVYIPPFVWPIFKIYANAECSKIHPGFNAPCMGTFGQHRRFGQSMKWQVNNWKSCQKGKGFCMEFLKPVGQITYFGLRNCIAIDTIPNTRDILRYRCD